MSLIQWRLDAKALFKLTWRLVTFNCFFKSWIASQYQKTEGNGGETIRETEEGLEEDINNMHMNLTVLKTPTEKTAEPFCLLLTIYTVATAAGLKNCCKLLTVFRSHGKHFLLERQSHLISSEEWIKWSGLTECYAISPFDYVPEKR